MQELLTASFHYNLQLNFLILIMNEYCMSHVHTCKLLLHTWIMRAINPSINECRGKIVALYRNNWCKQIWNMHNKWTIWINNNLSFWLVIGQVQQLNYTLWLLNNFNKFIYVCKFLTSIERCVILLNKGLINLWSI